jgi:hypothetical protein
MMAASFLQPIEEFCIIIINLQCHCRIELALNSKSAKLCPSTTCATKHDDSLFSNIHSIIPACDDAELIAEFDASAGEELTGLETFH